MARRRIESEPDLLAICRRRDDEGRPPQARVLLVRGGRTVVDRFTCDLDVLPDRLAELSCGRVLGVLPGSATLVRTIHVPPAAPMQVEAAIRLEAEARLLGSAPRHRTGIGIIGGDGDHPTGVVVAWPEGLDGGLGPLEGAGGAGFEIERVPEIACLAMLAGEAPSGLVASIDGHGRSRTVSVVVPTTDGPVFRSSRGGHGDLSDRLRPLVVESLLAEGRTPAEIESGTMSLIDPVAARTLGGLLVIDPDAEQRLSDRHDGLVPPADDPHAADDRLLLAALDVADGRLAALARLRAEETIEEPGFLRNVVHRLSDGRTAVAIVFVAILAMVLAPLAAAGIRLAVMRGKVEDLSALEARVRESENRQKVYRELDRQAWSITKLLGDVSNLMPEQIETVSISLSHGDPMSITGFAKRDGDVSGTDAVFDFNRRLRESGLFADAGPMPSIEPPDARGYSEFKITAELADPLRPLRPAAAEDYAVLSFSDRRFGPVDDDGYLIVDADKKESRLAAMIERGLAFDRALPELKADGDPNVAAAPSPSEASETTPPASPETGETTATGTADDTAIARGGGSDRPSRPERTTRPPRPSETERGADDGSTGGRDRTRGGTGGSGEPASRGSIRTNVVDIPPPITPEEVSVLSVAEARDRLSKVAAARSAPGLSDEDKERLKEEFRMLMERVREGAGS